MLLYSTIFEYCQIQTQELWYLTQVRRPGWYGRGVVHVDRAVGPGLGRGARLGGLGLCSTLVTALRTGETARVALAGHTSNFCSASEEIPQEAIVAHCGRSRLSRRWFRVRKAGQCVLSGSCLVAASRPWLLSPVDGIDQCLVVQLVLFVAWTSVEAADTHTWSGIM